MTTPLRWRIVPEEATEEMAIRGHDMIVRALDLGEIASCADVYNHMIRHSTSPTPEDIDALCRAMWPQSGCYEDKLAMRPYGEIAEWAKRDRTEYRQQMSAFLHRLGAKP